MVLPEPVGPVTSRMPSGRLMMRSNSCWSSVKPDFRQSQLQAFLVEDTHHDAFAVIRRQTRHAQVNQLGTHLRLNAPVLRDAMLGDGHVGLNFQPGDNGGLQSFGRRLHFLHHAVNAVAQPEFFCQRLQVNVRGAHLEGVHDDLIHQPDERRVRVHRPAVIRAGQVSDHVILREILKDILKTLVLDNAFFSPP